MNGGKNKKPLGQGYTIIEVMLFLAISGFMFVMAAIFINGKQANAEFKQSVNDTSTQIRTVMNDVVNGFYPTNSDFKCTSALTGPPSITTATSLQQGKNLGCVFIGKVIQFGVSGTGNAADGWSGYRVYSVAGRQFANGSAILAPQNFSDAQPKVVNVPSATDNKTLEWGLTITGICSPAPSPPATCSSLSPGAIGFFGAFGAFDSSNTLQSGSQEVNLALIPGSKLGDANELGNTQSLATSGSWLPNPNILLCFQGGKGDKASVTIGGASGQQLSTSIKIGDKRC